MAVELADAYISLVPSARGLGKGIAAELGDLDGHGQTAGDQAATGFMGKFKSGISGVGVAIGGAFLAAGIGNIVKNSIGAASDMNETVSKVGVIFGDVAGEVEGFASTSATALGQSKKEALDAAATFATFGKSAGLSGKDLAGFSTGLVGTSADLASFFNTSPEQAIEAIGAALRGESEPIRKYGVLLDDATLRNRALKLGLIETTKEALTPQQKVLAAQAEILAQTGDAQGDFARTADGAANKQKILTAQAANASAEFGSALLPIYTAIVTVLAEKIVPAITKLTGFLSEHKTLFLAVAGVVSVLTAGLITYSVATHAVTAATHLWTVATKAWSVVTKAASIVQGIFNAIMAANPIFLVVAAIAALAAGVIWAYFHFDAFRNIVDTAWQILQIGFNWVKDHWPLLLAILTGPFGLALLVVIKNFDTIKDFIGGVIGWIADHWQLILAIITGPIGLAVLLVTKNLDTIKDVFTSVKDWIWDRINDIVGFFVGIPGRIVASVAWIGDTIRNGIIDAAWWVGTKVNEIVGWFTGMPGRLAGAFGGMFNGISDAFRSAINFVIDGWNRLEFSLPKVDTPLGSFGGWSVGTPNIARLAAGGVVTQATLALLGERGPEAVIPLDKFAGEPSRGGGVRDITINTLGKPDAHELAREVTWAMKTQGM